MFYRKWIYGILISLAAVAVILGVIIFYGSHDRNLKVIFFDVGQGDAILISQGQNQVLIDGGKDGKTILEKLGKYVPFWDRTIETMIATHPDADHIGGLIEVAKNYKIGAVLETNVRSDSQTYQTLENVIVDKKIEKIEAVKDLTIKFSDGAELKILYPFNSVENQGSNSNDYSVVARLDFNDDSFLFTGDLPAEKELTLISAKGGSAFGGNDSNLNSRVLKVSHHGSKYSTSQEFLDAVNPKEAIISVGKNNSYGHPAPEIIERILKHGTKIWRIDEMGDIQYDCDANAIHNSCKISLN